MRACVCVRVGWREGVDLNNLWDDGDREVQRYEWSKRQKSKGCRLLSLWVDGERVVQ